MDSSTLRVMRSKTRLEDAGSAKPSRTQKRALYAVSALLWLSGAWWLYLSLLGRQAEDPTAPLLLEVHGAAAMGFLLVLGALLTDHLPRGWRQERERASGLSLVTLCAILIISGWGLYYFGQEQLRAATSWVHSVLGLLLPCAVGVHVWRGRRHRARLDLLHAADRDSSYASDAPAVASSAGR
jgi:MFS family permease